MSAGVVIVGASAGGLTVAEGLRRRGFDGRVTLIGAEPTPPYDRPPLSKQFMTGEWEAERLGLRTALELDDLQLDLRLGRTASGVKPDARLIELDDGNSVDFDELVIATGVRPRRLPGLDGVHGVHTLRTLADAAVLRDRLSPGRRLVVVGAGFLGAEVADAARSQGIDVTVLEADSQPMAQAVGAEAGDFLGRLHRARGTDLRTGVAVARVIHDAGAVTGVELTDGSIVPADDVLVAIGSSPNTDWLEGSRLTVQDGLVCDEYSMAAPHIHGVGDVARWYNPLFDTSMRVEHRTNAAEQGLAVAANIMQPDGWKPFAPVPYVWSDQLGLRIQTYGYLRGHEEALVVECDVESRRLLVLYRRGERLAGILAAGQSPKIVRDWRARIANGARWDAARPVAA